MRLCYCKTIPYKKELNIEDYRYDNKLYLNTKKKFSIEFVIRDADRKRKIDVEIGIWTNLNHDNPWEFIHLTDFYISGSLNKINEFYTNIFYKVYGDIIPTRLGNYEFICRARIKYNDQYEWNDWTWYKTPIYGGNIPIEVLSLNRMTRPNDICHDCKKKLNAPECLLRILTDEMFRCIICNRLIDAYIQRRIYLLQYWWSPDDYLDNYWAYGILDQDAFI